jgi:hypothetical protein
MHSSSTPLRTDQRLEKHGQLAEFIERLTKEHFAAWDPIAELINEPLICGVGVPLADGIATSDDVIKVNKIRWDHWKDWVLRAGAMVRQHGQEPTYRGRKNDESALGLARQLLAASTLDNKEEVGRLVWVTRNNAHVMQDLDEALHQVIDDTFADWKPDHDNRFRDRCIAECHRLKLPEDAFCHPECKGQLSGAARRLARAASRDVKQPAGKTDLG